MPIATIQLDDGRTVKLEVPQGATPDQINSFVSSNLDQFSAQPSANIPLPTEKEKQSGFADFFTGANRATELTESLPELQSSGLLAGENQAKIAAITPALATAIDPNEIVSIITSNFPDVGVVYNKDGEGNVIPVLRNNKTGAATIINKPGISGIDVLQGLGLAAAFTSAAKGASASARGLGALAAKGAATQTGIEAAQAASGGDFDPEDVAIAAAAMPVGQAVGEKVISPLAKAGSQKAKQIFTTQSPAKQRIAQMINEGSTDSKVAKYIVDGAGKVKSDAIAKDAIKQGFDEGVISAIKGANPKDRQVMARMVNTLKKGKTDARFAAENRPADAVGDSIVSRFRAVKAQNRQAGKQLDKAANRLKNKEIDFSSAVNKFTDDLDGLGVSIGDDLKPVFAGSDIEGLAGPENAIKNIVRRMSKGDKVDAYDVHRMKKFIDEQVTYGKTAEGLSGKTENILKTFRRNLDQSLDSQFPDYNKVNTKYADTISALDSFKTVAGKSFDPLSDNAEKTAGTLSRRLLSNAQSRAPLMDALNEMQNVGAKYGANFADDIITQAMFADELANMFGSSAKTSFEGGIEKASRRAIETARRGPVDVALDIGEAAAKKARGVNEENAIKAIENLLKR